MSARPASPRASGVNRVVDRRAGYDSIARGLRALRPEHVVVGVRQDAGAEVAEGDTLTLAQVAAVVEYGRPSREEQPAIPPRPFLRQTFDENLSAYDAVLRFGVGEAIDAAVAGGNLKKGLRSVLISIASGCVGHVQENMATPGKWVPNAPSTIAKKGSSQPTIDSGRLRQSIDYELRPGNVPRTGARGAA